MIWCNKQTRKQINPRYFTDRQPNRKKKSCYLVFSYDVETSLTMILKIEKTRRDGVFMCYEIVFLRGKQIRHLRRSLYLKL